MRRVLLWTVVPAATGLCLWAAALSWSSAPCPAEVGCKPEAPILVTLTPDGGTSGVVRASFDIRPVLEMSEVRWSWELSPDVHLLEGDATGTAAGGRGTPTGREASFGLPNDGRHHEARLVVTGLLADDSEDDGQPEPVTVVRTLSWGEPEPATKVVWSPDVETGALVEVAVVPTTHVPAPQGRAGGR